MSTFSKENSLPSLPIPDLKTTLKKYDQSQQASLSAEDYAEFKKVLASFENSGEAEQLQARFLEKFIKNNHSNTPLDDQGQPRNWLERLWEEKAYTDYRGPLYHINYGGCMMNNRIKNESQKSEFFDIDYITDITYGYAKVWHALKHQKFPVQNFRGMDWSMDIFSKFFNASQESGKKADIMNYSFTTVDQDLAKNSETTTPPLNYCIFLINGKFYKIDVADSQGRIYARSVFYQVISDLVAQLRARNETAISDFTENVFTADLMDRDTAYQFKSEFDEITAKNWKIVSDSTFVNILDLDQPGKLANAQRFSLGMLGNEINRVYHKAPIQIFYQDGFGGYLSNHAVGEGTNGMFVVREMNNIMNNLDNFDQKVSEDNFVDLPIITELEFHFPNPEKWRPIFEQQIGVYHQTYKHNLKAKLYKIPIGKNDLRPFTLHPNANVMIAIQYAYYKLHGQHLSQWPTTYETGQLRQFWHGRTETTRSFTLATRKYIEAMMEENSKLSNDEKLELFVNAHMAYLGSHMDSMSFTSFDRHLLALNNLEPGTGPAETKLNSLTNHFTYKKGGASNFIISSSSGGSQTLTEKSCIPATGCMPFRMDGYGCFTFFDNENTWVNIMWCAACPENDGEKFGREIEKCMREVLEMLKEA